MTVSTAQLVTGEMLVGFVAVKIPVSARLYEGVRLTAHPDNTAPIWISNKLNESGYPLLPGASVELSVDSLDLYATSTDIEERLAWAAI